MISITPTTDGATLNSRYQNALGCGASPAGGFPDQCNWFDVGTDYTQGDVTGSLVQFLDRDKGFLEFQSSSPFVAQGNSCTHASTTPHPIGAYDWAALNNVGTTCDTNLPCSATDTFCKKVMVSASGPTYHACTRRLRSGERCDVITTVPSGGNPCTAGLSCVPNGTTSSCQ